MQLIRMRRGCISLQLHSLAEPVDASTTFNLEHARVQHGQVETSLKPMQKFRRNLHQAVKPRYLARNSGRNTLEAFLPAQANAPRHKIHCSM